MSFNLRIMRHSEPDGTFHYCLQEVIYDDDGKVCVWCSGESTPGGKSIPELIASLNQMADAFRLPVLCGRTGAEIEPAFAAHQSGSYLKVGVQMP